MPSKITEKYPTNYTSTFNPSKIKQIVISLERFGKESSEIDIWYQQGEGWVFFRSKVPREIIQDLVAKTVSIMKICELAKTDEREHLVAQFPIILRGAK